MKKIVAMQNPISCADASYLVCKTIIKCGLGCSMHKLAWCFAIALQRGRTLIAEENYLLDARLNFRHDACEPNSGDLTCWFKPLSRCTAWLYQNQNNSFDSVDVQTISWTHNHSKVHANLSAVVATPTFNGVDLSNDHFTDVPHRLCWLQSMLIGYLFQPNDAVHDFIEHRQRRFNIVPPSLGARTSQMDLEVHKDSTRWFYGVHIRRGDKMREVKHRNVSEYPEALRALATKHSDLSSLPPYHSRLHGVSRVCSVFLATDDEAIIAEFVNLLHVNGTSIPSELPDSLKGNQKEVMVHCAQWKVIQTERVPSTRQSWEAIAGIISDTDTLANAVGFVGTQCSNIGRLVFELMTFRNAHLSDSIEHRVFSLGGPFTIMHHESLLKSYGPYEHLFQR